MPIYEYACKDCGAQFEVLRSMKDSDSPIRCDKCQSVKTARKVTSCYAQSGGHALAGSSGGGGCAGCAGGTCASCGH